MRTIPIWRTVCGFGLLAIIAGCGGSTTPPSDPPEQLRLEAVTPTQLTAAIGSRIDPDPTVRVMDSKGPRAGIPVQFDFFQRYPTVTVMSDQAGQARVPWTINDPSASLAATISSGAAVVFHAEAPLGPAVRLEAGASPPPTILGTEVSVRPLVAVLDQFNRRVPGATVRFEVLRGGGTITGEVAVSDQNGEARLGSWRLGPTDRIQWVLATMGTAKDSIGVIGAPVTFEPLAPTAQRVHILKEVPGRPAVRALDALGQPMAGVPVSFRAYHGTSTVGVWETETDSAGAAQSGPWVVAHETIDYQATASTLGWPTLVFTATAVLPGAARLEVVSRISDRGQVGNFLGLRPSIRVLDSADAPIFTYPVEWTVSPGTTVPHRQTRTDFAGLAAVEGWRLGPDLGTHTVTATVEGFAPVTFTATAEPLPTTSKPFNIEVRIIGMQNLTPEDSAEIITSGERWAKVMRMDLPPVTITPADSVVCGEKIVGTIDDVLVLVIVGHIDGPGNDIGGASPCVVRTGSLHPVVGLVTLDAADFVGIQPGLLGDAMAHQIGHVLGIGSLWEAKGLMGASGYTGAFARSAFHGLAYPGDTFFSQERVPVAGGVGPVLGHWVNVGAEMMNPHIERAIRLSALSVAGLRDLGYQASDAAADPHGFVSYLRSLMMGTPRIAGREQAPDVGLWIADPAGSVKPAPPSLLRQARPAR